MKRFRQILGTMLFFIGGLAAFFFGVLFFVLFLSVGLYGTGIIAAVIYVLPAFLISLKVSAFGRNVRNRANKMPSQDDLLPYSPPHSVEPSSFSNTVPEKELS